MARIYQILVDIMKTKIILAVLAHPDDESFGMGGIAYYAEMDDVYLVGATREASHGRTSRQLQTTAEKREAELRCASQTWRPGCVFSHYRDSGMPGSKITICDAQIGTC
jgi:LmbE family N-acetylglucosaminyl deacetylase